MFKFITSKPLWVNILAGIALAIALFFGFIFSLNWITSHGKSSTVPLVTGLSYDAAREKLEQAGFDVSIQDSVYTDTAKAFQVLKQFPEGEEIVKNNRTIFLVINRAEAPLIDMPDLRGKSFRSAELELQSRGLLLGDTSFKPDFARNAVLEQLYSGVNITPGTKVRMGSRISFVLGDGVGNQRMLVPSLVGLTFAEAREVLITNGLDFGSIMALNITDTAAAYIYKQSPERLDEERKVRLMRSGQLIDVWLQAEPVVLGDSLIEEE